MSDAFSIYSPLQVFPSCTDWPHITFCYHFGTVARHVFYFPYYCNCEVLGNANEVPATTSIPNHQRAAATSSDQTRAELRCADNQAGFSSGFYCPHSQSGIVSSMTNGQRGCLINYRPCICLFASKINNL